MTSRRAPRTIRSSLRHLDVDAVSRNARSEARSRQTHLPPISVYRWWARRTETVGGAILDAYGRDRPGRLKVADPFAGGGVLGLATLMRGHQLYAQDVNPWAAHSLATMLTLPDAQVLARAAAELEEVTAGLMAEAYGTTLRDGTPGHVSHTLRVAVSECLQCDEQLKLFPSALVSMTARVDTNQEGVAWLACAAGHLTARELGKGRCGECARVVVPTRRYTSERVARCSSCGWKGKLSDLAAASPLRWEVVLVERRAGSVREIGRPTELELAQASDGQWTPTLSLPRIEDNAEASVLVRHGFTYWHDLYPDRQRVVLERLLDACSEVAGDDGRLETALRSAVLGSVEMAGRVSRWDGRYLKAYEAVSNHRYNFSTLPVEPNIWGEGSGRGTVSRRLSQLEKASVWLGEQTGGRLVVQGPLAAVSRRRVFGDGLDVRVVSGSSEKMLVSSGQLDLVLTDPPYHDDVQYGDLSDLFRAWASMGTGRIAGEAVASRQVGTDEYEELLRAVFVEVRRALAEDGHVILSYANRSLDAWVALLRALDAAGLVAVGVEVVHAENELDHSKWGKRSCTMDVLIDLVADPGDRSVARHRPRAVGTGAEAEFCLLVAEQALQVGRLKPGWEERFRKRVSSCAFLRAGSSA